MAYQRMQLGQIAVVAEDTAGTFKAATASNCFLAQNIQYSLLEAENYQRNELHPAGDFGKLQSVPAGRGAQLSFEFALKGAGNGNFVSGVAPDYAEVMAAAGFARVVESGVSTQFQLTKEHDGSTSVDGGVVTINPSEGYSFSFIQDGVLYGVRGARAQISFAATVNEPIIASVTVQGGYVAISGQELFDLASVEVDDIVPPTFNGASLTLFDGSSTFSPVFDSLTYDMGNELVLRKDANNSEGVLGAALTNRRPVGTINIEMPEPGDNDIFDAWKDGADGAISTGTIGSSAGNRISISAPNCAYTALAPADKNGIVGVDVNFEIFSPLDSSEASAFTITVS